MRDCFYVTNIVPSNKLITTFSKGFSSWESANPPPKISYKPENVVKSTETDGVEE